MSNFAGERYSTLVPVSLAAASAPFLTTAQKGSETTPWVTRWILWVCPHPKVGASAIREVNKICLSRLFNFIASNLSCALMERAKHHGALGVRASTNPLLRNRQSDFIASEKRWCGSQPNRHFWGRNGRSLCGSM